MSTLIGFVVVLGILIFIHEFGHFAVAKLSGIKVEVFSLGFGPQIVGFQRGETLYRIGAIPLGGYVKMLGEEPGEETDDPRAFSNQPLLTRLAVVVAGPLMNLLFAFMILPVSYMVGVSVPAYMENKPVVGYVEDNTPAMKAGFKEGDVIVAVAEKKVTTWEDFLNTISLYGGKEVEVSVIRQGKTLALKMKLPEKINVYSLGLLPEKPPVVGDVVKDSPAEKAGLKKEDKIVEINGIRITSWYQIGKVINSTEGEITLSIKRGDRIFQVKLSPEKKDGRRIIGIVAPYRTIVKKYPPGEAIVKGFQKNLELFALTFKVIGNLFTGKLSLKVLGGPIQIAVVSGEAVKKGVGEFLLLMAFISLQLGILNLLPIPVLDGGYILFFLIEAIRGKPLSEKFIAISLQIGFFLLLLLMLIVTKNDIMRFWGEKISNLVGR